jgi:hypothetical protein
MPLLRTLGTQSCFFLALLSLDLFQLPHLEFASCTLCTFALFALTPRSERLLVVAPCLFFCRISHPVTALSSLSQYFTLRSSSYTAM